MEFCTKKFKYDFELFNHAPISNKSTGLVDINDDCIDTIFDWLSLDDLSAMGATCEKLLELAGKFFQRKYPENQIGIRVLETGIEPEIDEKYKKHLIAFFRNVKIADHSNKPALIPLFKHLKWNCCENLRELEFYWMNFDAKTPYGDMIADQLANLESIAFVGCSIKDLFEMFLKYCSNLKHLTIKDGFAPLQEYFDAEWTHQLYFKLEGITYYIDHENYRDNFHHFFQINQQIKTVACSGLNVMQTIFESKLHLELLSLRFYNESEFQVMIDDLQKCSAKKLQLIFDTPISFTSVSLLMKLGRSKSFQILHCTYAPEICNEVQFASLLKSMEHLEIFHLKFDRLSDEDLTSLSLHLPCLTELHLQQYLGNPLQLFRSNGFKAFLMPFVENAKNLKKIVIHKPNACIYDCNELIESIDDPIEFRTDLIELCKKRKEIKAKAITLYFDYDLLRNIDRKLAKNNFITFRPISQLKRDRYSNECLQFV